MAGTLFGVPLSQQIGTDGTIASGALIYVYAANTSTPAQTFADFSLTSLQTWPLEADSAGRVPAFWVDDGSYRLRITTSAGVELIDEQSITSIGASSNESGSSVAADTSTIFQTGDMLWLPITGTRSGWVRSNGRTIGNGSSGATERANSDTQSLFEYLWNNFSNSFCAVSGGRGASATADFNASKTIATLDMRSKGIIGLDTMGNSAASVTGGSSTAADAVGASTYTVAQANLPNVNFAITDTRKYEISMWSTAQQDSGPSSPNESPYASAVTAVTTLVMASPSSGSAVAASGGSGTDIDILPPVRVGTFYQKL